MIEQGNESWRELVPEGADKILHDYLSDKGTVVWFTGLSRVGKREISKLVTLKLEQRGIRTESLDGSILRKTISKDLGFSKKERDQNLERAVYIAKRLARNRALVLCSFITPYTSQRKTIREELEKNSNFIEVYVKASLETCKKRDNDGIYKLAEEGKIDKFTGVSAPYEEPKDPTLVLDTEKKSFDECAEIVVKYLDSLI